MYTLLGGSLMITQDSVLVQLLRLVDRIATPPPPPCRPRGQPYFYSEKLFIKALVVMIVRHLYTVHELLVVLEEPTHKRCAWCGICCAR
jgi:hypothetical protein